ncbi:MAG: hypothetical protein KY449_05035 [Proteobacteria bacterium]|nr:hypothetical protein [Pseudomonadota bacterium]
MKLSVMIAVISLAAAGAASAQGAGALSPAELDGRWTLTIRGDPPGSKGPRISFTDEKGQPLKALPIDLQVEIQNGRVGRSQVTRQGMPSSRKSTPCRLEKGAFVVEIAGSGNGRQGVMTTRLSRGASGAIAGPVTARAARLPVSFRIGSATLVRAS